jgi:hypothetical protein
LTYSDFQEQVMSEYQEQDSRPARAAAGMWEPSQRQAFDPRRKSPILATAISIFPGIGQIYIGYYVRGFLTAAIFLILVFSSAEMDRDLGPALAMAAFFMWIFNLIDAGRMAALYNHAAAGSNTLEMPKDLKLPRLGGSIMGGLILLAFGGIALSYTAFGYPLDWLERWWPAFPAALGLYLLARGVIDAMAERPEKSEPPSSQM